jgi:hypothetical protein
LEDLSIVHCIALLSGDRLINYGWNLKTSIKQSDIFLKFLAPNPPFQSLTYLEPTCNKSSWTARSADSKAASIPAEATVCEHAHQRDRALPIR